MNREKCKIQHTNAIIIGEKKENAQIEAKLSEKKEFSEKYKSLLSIFNNVYSVMKELATDK